MTPQEKEMQALQDEIKGELQAIFKANMKIFDWDIPENDDKASAKLIIEVMQKALNELKAEIEDGKYDNY